MSTHYNKKHQMTINKLQYKRQIKPSVRNLRLLTNKKLSVYKHNQFTYNLISERYLFTYKSGIYLLISWERKLSRSLLQRIW